VSRFLTSYLSGNHVSVWDEMRRLPPLSPPPATLPLLEAIDRFPDEHAAQVRDVEAVCFETMRRVRANLEMISFRLHARGYIFHDHSGRRFVPLTGPERDSEELVRLAETTLGPLPRSVQAFITVVGEVCFLGNYLPWGIDYPATGHKTFIYDPKLSIKPIESPGETAIWYPDPLVIEFRYGRYGLSLDEVMRHHTEVYLLGDGGPRGLEFSADAVHKAGYSGGTPYYVHVPDGGADGIVALDTRGDMYFVDYLRHAILEWGGFPGFEAAPAGRDAGLIAELKRDLIPF
jgi:hypothetical protein